MQKNRMLNPTMLDTFLEKETQGLPNASGLTHLLLEIASCSQNIASIIARGALGEASAKLASINVQGETQMALDVLCNDLFVASLRKSGVVAAFVSEEMDEPVSINTQNGQFIVNFDPLDGSSNVAVNVSVGTIFSILPASNPLDYLQSGTAQIAAGYVLYGPATKIVLTLGAGTHGFTLDSDTQQYVLTHPQIQIPELTNEYAINASNARFWQAPVQRYIAECNAGKEGVRGQDFNMRWVASMVADVHRILMRGGVYLYPQDNKLPLKAGRLRLLYEASPMSFIVEQAGGLSTTGRARIMQITPENVHQRVPVIMGSRAELSRIEQYHQAFDEK